MIRRPLAISLFFALLLAIWEVACLTTPHTALMLPPPSRILYRMASTPDIFWLHTASTLAEMVISLLLATGIAFPLAWWMAHRRLPRLAFQPLFVISQCIPVFTLAPLMVLWFDWSAKAVILPTALMILFPLTLTIYQGFRATPHEWMNFFHANQASAWKTFYKLELPAAHSHIFSGFRIAAAVAGISAVGGEWAGAQCGLGMFMQECRRNIDIEATFGALFCLGLASGLLYVVITAVEALTTSPRRDSTLLASSRLALCSVGIIALLLNLPALAPRTPHHSQVRLMLDWLPNPNHVPLYAGLQMGFFEEEGIDLRILKLQDPADTIPFLATGQTDFALYYALDTLKAAAKGAPIKVAASLISQPLEVLLFRDELPIQELSDLAGRKIGHFGIDLHHLYLDAIGVPVHRCAVNFDVVAALASGKIDASLGTYYNIEPEQLRSLGIETRFFSLETLGVPHHPALVVLANNQVLRDDPMLGRRFRRALAKSIAYARDHTDEAFRRYLQCLPEKAERTQEWERRAWEVTASMLSISQEFNLEEWERFASWLYTNGILEEELSMRGLLL